MVFSSLVFLFVFLPLAISIYYFTPDKYRNFILFLASLFFYAWGEPVYIFLMLFSTFVDFTHGLLIKKYRQQPKLARIFLLSSVFINLSILGFFKYYDFLLSSINTCFGTSWSILQLPLPLGISFYTFQTMSYTIDVYRGEVEAQENIVSFGAYISLFPQLIAGPIVRYKTIAQQINQRETNWITFGIGLRRFITGLAKKVLLANNIGLLWETVQTMPTHELTVLSSWLGIVAFALQIYFDFSGYSDMAIGLGKIFGFTFLENFNYPYIAQSITEFWRRWHISLGSWFREYVYIPLGGNRVSSIKQYRNLFIVWFLTGLWHGASWNFVLWGLYFGLLIALEKAFLTPWLLKTNVFWRHFYTILLVMLSWVLFLFEDGQIALEYFGALFGFGNINLYNNQALYLLYTHALLLVIAIIGSTPLVKNLRNKLIIRSTWVFNLGQTTIYFLFLFISIAYLVDASYNPFLYFRF